MLGFKFQATMQKMLRKPQMRCPAPGEYLGLETIWGMVGGMSHFLPLPRCRAFVYSEMYGTCKLLLPEVKYFLFTTPQRHLCATVPEMSRNSAWLLLYLSECCVCYIFIHRGFLQNLSIAIMLSRRISGLPLRVNSSILSLALLSG